MENMDGEFLTCLQDCSLHILNIFGVLGGGDSQATFRKYNWRVAVRLLSAPLWRGLTLPFLQSTSLYFFWNYFRTRHESNRLDKMQKEQMIIVMYVVKQSAQRMCLTLPSLLTFAFSIEQACLSLLVWKAGGLLHSCTGTFEYHQWWIQRQGYQRCWKRPYWGMSHIPINATRGICHIDNCHLNDHADTII